MRRYVVNMQIFTELYKYREFLKTSIKKEFRGKYKKSFPRGCFGEFFLQKIQNTSIIQSNYTDQRSLIIPELTGNILRK